MVILTIPKTRTDVNDFQNSFHNLLIFNNYSVPILANVSIVFSLQIYFSAKTEFVKYINFTSLVLFDACNAIITCVFPSP